jgi:hypothetical protein
MERDGLKSVNWVTGMLLTPAHFTRQDRYVDQSVGWLVRYCVPGAGLVGGGLRVDATRTGLAAFDPQLFVHDNGQAVRVGVVSARGITPAGEIVEISETDPVGVEVDKAALAGVNESLVYVVRTGEKEEDPASVGEDDANPTHAALRRPSYAVRLGADPEVAEHALVVGRIRRVSETLGFDADGHFIPPCAFVLAHSALHGGWNRLRADVADLAGRYSELHRTVAAYAEQIALRGVDTTSDRDVLAFVERAVLALDHCAYEILDASMPPQRLFQQIDRAGRRVAIALDLSAATRLYFRSLTGADAGYDTLLEEERQSLASRREWSPREDVRYSLERSEQTLGRLRRLFEALEARYVDYRINRSIDSLRFLLEDGGEGFYVAIATPGHPQRDGDLLTFDFAQMNLPGQHEYRVLLVGDGQGMTPWQVGEGFEVDVRVNPAGGFNRPLSRTVRVEDPRQRNFAVNFETPPDVATLSSLRVTLHQGGHRIRRAVLYQRGRGLIAEAQEPAPLPSSFGAQPSFGSGSSFGAQPSSGATPSFGAQPSFGAGQGTSGAVAANPQAPATVPPRIAVPVPAAQPEEPEEPRIKRIPLRRRDP